MISWLLPLSVAFLVTADAVQSTAQTQFGYKDCKPADIKNLVVFGDSFSDTGNVYRISNGSWPVAASYPGGRFTNGPNWADYVAKDGRFKMANFAFGSATTDSETVQGYSGSKADIPVPGFLQQIDKLYLPGQSSEDIDELDSTLFIVNFQGNDYYFNETIGPAPVLANIERGIHRLVEVGARHILVVENIDLGRLPYYLPDKAVSQEYSALSEAQYRGYERMIRRMAQKYGSPARRGRRSAGRSNSFQNCRGEEDLSSDMDQRPENRVNVAFFDLHTLLHRMASPKSLKHMGITDVEHACLSGDGKTQCADPSQVFYYDSFHASTKVHRQIANSILHHI
ncbi:hypothetical protein BGZ70_001842 [Mortierella alpina]|uniref:Uncharacterized protein n=1 Tax=Mortierella alpina TaxID=64518 RepID=A0A9P6IV76_MORAP|nr:hypothetical protein BGZ70_001842 [Mortierella alpina]